MLGGHHWDAMIRDVMGRRERQAVPRRISFAGNQGKYIFAKSDLRGGEHYLARKQDFKPASSDPIAVAMTAFATVLTVASAGFLHSSRGAYLTPPSLSSSPKFLRRARYHALQNFQSPSSASLSTCTSSLLIMSH